MKRQMQQGVSWAFALVGIGLFCTQAGEILVGHDTWGQVLTPHGVGDLLKVAGTAVMAALGALGIKMSRDANGTS